MQQNGLIIRNMGALHNKPAKVSQYSICGDSFCVVRPQTICTFCSYCIFCFVLLASANWNFIKSNQHLDTHKNCCSIQPWSKKKAMKILVIVVWPVECTKFTYRMALCKSCVKLLIMKNGLGIVELVRRQHFALFFFACHPKWHMPHSTSRLFLCVCVSTMTII